MLSWGTRDFLPQALGPGARELGYCSRHPLSNTLFKPFNLYKYVKIFTVVDAVAIVILSLNASKEPLPAVSSYLLMRVGVNGRTFSVDEPRGSVLSSVQFVRALQRHERIDVTVFGSEEVESHFTGVDVDVAVSSWAPTSQTLGLLWEQVVLPSMVNSTDVHLLLCPNSDGPMRQVSVPQVTKIHDLFGYLGYGPRFYEILQRRRIPRMVGNSDLILVPSAHTGEVLTQNVDVGTDDVEVIPNGIAEVFLGDDPGDPVPTPDRYILYVGGTDPRKNVDGLLQAFEIYRASQNGDSSLLMVGPSNRFIAGNATDVDVTKKGLEVLGFVDSAELKYLYSNAQALVFPSLDEGFGLPPIEAMACGTPVVTSNRRPMTDVLGDYAWYVDPTDPEALAATIADVTTGGRDVERLVAGGREHAQTYTWKRAAVESYRTFCQLLSKR